MEVKNKKKNILLIIKILIGSIPILLVIIWFISLRVNGNKYRKEFFRSEISSLVIKSDTYYGRSIEFHLDNGMTLYFMPPIGKKIQIGDSVKKESNSFIYDVYRKKINDGYEYWATYDGESIY